jgi:hypothetical protein
VAHTDDLRDYEPIHPKGFDWRGLLRKIWAPVLVVGALVVKFGVPALKFASIFVAVGGYALLWGWRFAIGFVLLILVHELGVRGDQGRAHRAVATRADRYRRAGGRWHRRSGRLGRR